MKLLLQQYDNGKWGYKGIDDCANENMLDGKGIGEDCRVINEQREGEDRESFFNRIGDKPIKDEYGSNEKLDEKIINEDLNISIEVIQQNYGLNRFLNSRIIPVRVAVAEKAGELGRENILEKLINDKDPSVRTIAETGYGLDVLINDEDGDVRRYVAKQGYGLDVLVNDKDEWVRQEVTRKAGELGREDLIKHLITDKNRFVREEAINVAVNLGSKDLLQFLKLSSDKNKQEILKGGLTKQKIISLFNPGTEYFDNETSYWDFEENEEFLNELGIIIDEDSSIQNDLKNHLGEILNQYGISWIYAIGSDYAPFCDSGGWGSSNPYTFFDSNGLSENSLYIDKLEIDNIVKEKGFKYYNLYYKECSKEEATYAGIDSDCLMNYPYNYLCKDEEGKWYDASKYPNDDQIREYDLFFFEHIKT